MSHLTLDLVFVEAALELVPVEILGHPSVRRNAKRRGKRPEETLLDRSLHHYAMTGLPGQEKRGRPDILHFCLLEAMGSPLNRTGNLRVWVSTQRGKLIGIDPSTRPPRDFNRFKSLMEQLLLEASSPPGVESPLLRVRNMSLGGLVEELNPGMIVALTSHGSPGSFAAAAEMLCGSGSPAVFVGAYPSGPMEEETLALADEALSVYAEPLEAWTVVSRL
ncbi:MAG: 16S rRNA methyltransferase, partial [Anaerolineae bacterium]|nr:16S rRNA methyltransferase [Anaerolineae bacterium]NIN96510.1 16S rRNA methyltransferase [Anaerolineae bacterium]NIQ79540.1 16S rRNA methyltransferase [Anaerolineae bacterium]